MDYDGTLLPFQGKIADADIEASRALGRLGAVRAVATGRSVETFRKDWDPSFEVDYLISSSGLGLSKWGPEGHVELLESKEFAPVQARLAVELAREADLGFFLALPPPDTHRSFFQPPEGRPAAASFLARVKHSGDFVSPWDGSLERPLGQALVMGEAEIVRELEKRFHAEAPGLSTVICSSPYGDGTLWLEIYPGGVSKGQTAARLAARLGLAASDAVAMGNDFNDEDLLRWAGRAYVSEDSPEPLRTLYRRMPPAGRGPLAYVTKRLVSGWQERS
jgi:hydroxymethylpyrimidine pyrophosphatase-like HAD family hydrolase